MKYNWKKATLDDVCSLVTDGAHNSPKSVTCGEYMVSVKDFTEYGFDFTHCKMISKEDYRKLEKQGCVPKIGDVLVGKDGARYFEDIIIYKQEEKPALLSSVAILRADKNRVLPEYLYYTLKSPLVKRDVKENYGSGSAIPRIVLKDFKRMPIRFPDIELQEKIVALCKMFDEKIENNIAINNNLEEQGHSFYKKFNSISWDWREGTVGDVVTLQRGYDLPKTKMIKGKYPVAGSTDTIFFHNQYMAEAPCIVLGRSGNIGKPRLYLEPCWPHNTSLFTKQFKNSNPLWVYFMLYNLDYSMFQGGSAVPTLNRNHIHSYAIKIPPIAEQNKFAQTIEPLIKAIFHNRKEIETLSKLRNTLLPRLMSGEIDVSCVS